MLRQFADTLEDVDGYDLQKGLVKVLEMCSVAVEQGKPLNIVSVVEEVKRWLPKGETL